MVSVFRLGFLGKSLVRVGIQVGMRGQETWVFLAIGFRGQGVPPLWAGLDKILHIQAFSLLLS